MVRAIAASGHEVACHGFNHDMLTALDEAAIRQDVADAKALLEDSSGTPVSGYRAPNLSITDRALDILADLGFVYDSSVFPFAHHNRYGKIDTSLFEEIAPNIYHHRTNGLLEFVLPMRRFGRLGLPWAGGGYFRLFPAGLYRRGVQAILKRHRAFIFYMHPWGDRSRAAVRQDDQGLRPLPSLRRPGGRLSEAGPASRPVRRHAPAGRSGRTRSPDQPGRRLMGPRLRMAQDPIKVAYLVTHCDDLGGVQVHVRGMTAGCRREATQQRSGRSILDTPDNAARTCTLGGLDVLGIGN